MLLQQFVNGAAGLSRTQFEEHHPQPALVFSSLAVFDSNASRKKTRADHEVRRVRITARLPKLYEHHSEDRLTGSVKSIKKSENNPMTAVCVGRADWNDIVLADDTVSKSHALFLVFPDSCKLIDQGSMNGTWVNDELIPLEVAVNLTEGAKISFGRHASAKFYTSYGLWKFVQFCRRLSKTG